MTEPQRLAKILSAYYGVPSVEIEAIINSTNSQYATDVKDSANRVYQELKVQHFDRQQEARKRLYAGITFQNVIDEITPHNIQYIMTKTIAKWYYEDIDSRIKAAHPEILLETATIDIVKQTYLDNIHSELDFYTCHLELINRIMHI